MTDVIASLPVPVVNKQRLIWQPVAGADGVKMRLAPLDWQPAASHAALEHLASTLDALNANG